MEEIQSVHKSVEDIFLRRNPKIKREELNWRADERLEWQCKHGVGHTVFSPVEEGEDEGFWTHGCCMECECSSLVKFEIKFLNVNRGKKNVDEEN